MALKEEMGKGGKGQSSWRDRLEKSKYPPVRRKFLRMWTVWEGSWELWGRGRTFLQGKMDWAERLRCEKLDYQGTVGLEWWGIM